MSENQGRIRALLDETLAGEPPLLDLVPDAVRGAEHGRRRGRLMAGGAAVAVLAVAAGTTYGMADHGRGKAAGSSETVSPGNSGAPSTSAGPAPKSHKSDLGIPGLFDNPGTPQQQCAKVDNTKSLPALTSVRDYCVRALTQFRALLPDAVVVVEPIVDFNQPVWSAPLVQTPDGGTAPGFTQTYQAAAGNPAKVTYTEIYFAFHTARGDGIVTYQTAPPGVRAKQQPGGDLPLGDGTSGHFEDGDAIGANGVTATGLWYALSITGVFPVYGAAGSTLEPNLHGDGKDHEVFPDGYVMATSSGEKTRIPNPYTGTEIRDRIKAVGLGTLVTSIGADPGSVAVPPQ